VTTVPVLDLQDAETDWAALVARQPVDLSPFATRGWLSAWTAAFAGTERPEAVLAGEPAEPTGGLVAALARRPVLPALRVQVMLGCESADYAPAVAVDDAAAGALAERWLGGTAAPALLLVGRLRPDGLLLPALQRTAAGRGWTLTPMFTEEFPVVTLGADGDVDRDRDGDGDSLDEAGLRRLAKRNDVLRRRRKLAEHGQVEVLPAQDPAGRPGLADFFALHDRRWRTKSGTPSGLFVAPRGRDMVRELAREWWADGLLRLSFVTVDGTPLAGRFGVRLGETYYGLKSAFDPEYATYGPGHMMTHAVMADALATGARRMEFMRGAGDHKRAWGGAGRPVSFWVASRGVPALAVPHLARYVLWSRRRRREGR
jgi:CelD/BcsL family acetyltransferase involved in cellulose biosynthesis